MQYADDDVLMYADDVLMYADDVLMYADDVLMYADDVLMYADDVLMYADDVLMYADDVLMYADDVQIVSSIQEGLQKSLPYCPVYQPRFSDANLGSENIPRPINRVRNVDH